MGYLHTPTRRRHIAFGIYVAGVWNRRKMEVQDRLFTEGQRRYLNNVLPKSASDAARLGLKGGFFRAGSLLFEDLTGRNPYDGYLRRRHGRYVERTVNGYRMRLDLEDQGLSRDLIYHGVRERHATKAFSAELKELLSVVEDDVVVLEAGANLGYYALMEAYILGDRGHILAVEPSPQTAALLRENVRLNGFENRFTIDECALSDSSGSATLTQRDQYNKNRLVNENEGDTPSVEVDVYQTAEFVESKGYSLEDLNVVRMDIQGQEYNVLRGMERIIENDAPLLAFIETHGSLSDDEFEWIADVFESNDYEMAWVGGSGSDKVEDYNDFRREKNGNPIFRNY